jgi:hypothetical protein
LQKERKAFTDRAAEMMVVRPDEQLLKGMKVLPDFKQWAETVLEKQDML